jgi:hypothetical protein
MQENVADPDGTGECTDPEPEPGRGALPVANPNTGSAPTEPVPVEYFEFYRSGS